MEVLELKSNDLGFRGIHVMDVDCDVCRELRTNCWPPIGGEKLWIHHVQTIYEIQDCSISFIDDLSLFLRLSDGDVKMMKLVLEKMPRSHAYYVRLIHNYLLHLPKISYDGYTELYTNKPGGDNYERYMKVTSLLFDVMPDDYMEEETGSTKMHLAVETSQWGLVNSWLR